MIEEWRKIPNYPSYEVSNTGRVRNSKGYELYPVEVDRHLRVQLAPEPYKPKTVSVVRLIYLTFCGAIPDGYHVFHKDGDYTNNTPQNLFLEKRGYK